MKKFIKTNIIIQIVFFLIIIFVNYSLAEDNKENEVNNINKKAEYIKQNCKIGKKYFLKDNKKFIKNVLIGEWAALPHSKINFLESGKFTLIYQMKNKLEGEWDVGVKSNLVCNPTRYIKNYFLLQ